MEAEITITEAIKELERIKRKFGDDVKLHLEVGEDEECDKCGQAEYRCKAGMCKSISVINVNGKKAAYLLADEG